MTDNEIIKALECCVECDTYLDECVDGCPLREVNDCTSVLRRITLDLINRQKAENAELQLKNSELESDLRLKTYDYEHLLMKCKELQAISSSRKDRLMQTVVKLQTAKSGAIKEFWDKLKEKRYGGIYPYVLITEGENLVKEMTEGGVSDA